MASIPRPCSVDGCDGLVKARGLCGRHYQAQHINAPDRPRCSVPDCPKPAAAVGMCHAHYRHAWKHGQLAIRTAQTGCSIEGCDRPHLAHGMCRLHYERQYRTAQPKPAPKRSPVGAYNAEDIARFWEHVNRVDDLISCWEWVGQESQAYPEAKAWHLPDGTRERVNAHVMSYQINIGPVPEGEWVLHRCDNPRCVRPDHLFIGPPDTNSKDMVAKGRSSKGDRHRASFKTRARGADNGAHTHPEKRPAGERHGMAILSEAAVREIKQWRPGCGVLQKDLARKHNVSQATISAIVTGRLWPHIK